MKNLYVKLTLKSIIEIAIKAVFSVELFKQPTLYIATTIVLTMQQIKYNMVI
jgi:hypothetical protein